MNSVLVGSTSKSVLLLAGTFRISQEEIKPPVTEKGVSDFQVGPNSVAHSGNFAQSVI